MIQVEKIQKGVREGNFLLLAKAISQIENNISNEILWSNDLPSNAIPVIGITGPPGA